MPTAAQSRALSPRGAAVYRLDVPRDLSITLIAASAWLLPELFRDDLVNRSCPCETAGLNALDRASAGVARPGPAAISNMAVLGVYGLAFGLDLVDVASQHGHVTTWLDDALVLAEVLAINGALNELAKIAVARPRPLLYGRRAGDPSLQVAENYTSFYSEHTSGTFAVGLAAAQTFALRHPGSPWRFVGYAAAVVAGGSMAVLRVRAGKHFPTDVLAGAAAGAAVGLLVPWLHARSHGVRIGVLPQPGGIALTFAMRGA